MCGFSNHPTLCCWANHFACAQSDQWLEMILFKSQSLSLPFNFEARLDHEAAYLQVLLSHLLSNWSWHLTGISFQLGSYIGPWICIFAGTIKSVAYKLKMALNQQKFADRKQKTTYNLHLQVVFENPNPNCWLVCVTIVRQGQLLVNSWSWTS